MIMMWPCGQRISLIMNRTAVSTLLSLALLFSINLFASHSDVNEALESENTPWANQAYTALSEAEKSSFAGQLQQARLLILRGEIKPAYELLEPMTEQLPDDVDLRYYYGLSAMLMAQQANFFKKMGYAKQGLRIWQEVLALDPAHTDALSGMIGFHLAAPAIAGGDKDQALEYAMTLKKAAPERGYIELANYYLATDQPQMADQTLAQGIEAIPDNSQIYFSRAMTQYQGKNWSMIRADLVAALEHASTYKEKNQALYQVGKLSVESEAQVSVGIGAFQQVLAEEFPYQADWSKYRLSQLYLKNEQPVEAKALLEQIDVSTNSDLKKRVKQLKKQL